MKLLKLKTFIYRHRITMTAMEVDHNPAFEGDEGATMSHWRCILRCGGRSMRVIFSMGSALQGPPQIGDVLDCLASDSRGDLDSFEAWCSEYGYDTDSRKALRTYEAVRRQASKLERLLGTEDYNFLLYNVQPL